MDCEKCEYNACCSNEKQETKEEYFNYNQKIMYLIEDITINDYSDIYDEEYAKDFFKYRKGLSEYDCELFGDKSSGLMTIKVNDKLYSFKRLSDEPMLKSIDNDFAEIYLEGLNEFTEEMEDDPIIAESFVDLPIDILKYLKYELLSERRSHKCHQRTLQLIELYGNSYAVTGTVNGNHTHYLHSVIETTNDNETYVIDWTKNLVMKAVDYYNLTKFEKLSSISCKDVIADREANISGGRCIKKYLLNRNIFKEEYENKK